MRRGRFRPVWLAALLLACSSRPPIPAPARFDRPNRVDFVCVDDGTPIRMHKCVPCSSAQLATGGKVDGKPVCNPQLNDAVEGPKLGAALHALVTQSARGQVAAVNLRGNAVLDSRRDIPGYTFVPVGVLPTAIVVPREHPQFTYVADFGSHDVRVLDTKGLVSPSTGDADAQIVTLFVDTPEGRVPAAPTDMVLAPDEDALFVALPDAGRVLRLPLLRCDKGAPDCRDGLIDEAGIAAVMVQDSMNRLATSAPSTDPSSAYAELCGYSLREPPPPQPVTLPNDAFTTPARPTALAIDAYCTGQTGCTRRLLVADEALPVIHAIDLDAVTPGSTGSDALLTPLVTGVTTLAVAVTPPVPVRLDSTEETQYVYAIDAGDGSVLVLEHGQLVNVNADPDGRPDRIEIAGIGPVRPSANALAVLTPGFNEHLPSNQQYIRRTLTTPPADADLSLYCTDTPDLVPNPARLRGVFLAVALTNGTVRIVDIHDLELGPSPKNACRQCAPGIPEVVRNRPRLAVNFTPAPGVAAVPLTPTVSTLAFQVSGLPFSVLSDGTSGSPDAPGLDCLACASDQVQIFPDPTQSSDQTSTATSDTSSCGTDAPALLCGSIDPWDASQGWAAVYEGLIPGTVGGGGRLVPPESQDNQSGAPELLAGVDFCEAGVLGDDDIGPAFDDSQCAKGAVGDQLVLTSPILGKFQLGALKLSSSEIAQCAEAAKAMVDDPTLRPAFGIRRAYRDRVVIRQGLVRPLGKLQSYEQVQRCLGGNPSTPAALTFQVQARAGFVVHGTQSGFVHRVHADADGRCAIDASIDPLRNGRALMGCTFRNHAVAFRIRKPAGLRPTAGLTLRVQTVSPATQLFLDAKSVGLSGATVVPAELRYSGVDQRLYLVDTQDRGLIPIPLNPFPLVVSSAGTFN
jgi:hypothetical protein